MAAIRDGLHNPLDLNPQRHRQSLALFASARPAGLDARQAFRHADRLCRTYPNDAIAHLLRFEALRQFSTTADALPDLRRAVSIDPWIRAVNLAALAWFSGEDQARAAWRLIEQGEPAAVRAAVAYLRANGEPAVAFLRSEGEDLTGWAIWDSPRPLMLNAYRDDGRQEAYPVEANADDAKSGLPGSETRIRIIKGAVAFSRVDVCLGADVVQRIAVPRRSGTMRRKPRSAPKRAPSDAGSVTIVVPVYEGEQATRLCLESALAQGAEVAIRVIVVDDASPNIEIRAYLDAGHAAGRFALIRNATNLGFAASVNKALEKAGDGDVLLLNADAVLPASALSRLQSASREAGIGTLTPFSNNGEETSFPRPSRGNDLGDLARIDRAAADANGTSVVDIPNGIGFCLYIIRACLDAVGALPDLYSRGYYEDVEFCLRAQERGFRNVCATGVYVGHAGSVSFGDEKRALVVRNFAILQRRFPGYPIESATFSKADPLKAPRARIERLLPPTVCLRLVVGGPGLSPAVVRQRTNLLSALSIDVLVIRWERRDGEHHVALQRDNGSHPQSLAFRLDDESERQDFSRYLRALCLDRIEIADAIRCPEWLMTALQALNHPLDLLCGDLLWFIDHAHRDRLSQDVRIAAIFRGASRIVPLDRMASAFARRFFSHVEDAEVGQRPLAVRTGALLSLGIILPISSPAIDSLLVAVGRHFRRRDCGTQLIVFGVCDDDLAVMASGNIFVTGPVDDDDYAAQLRHYRIDGLFSPYRTCLFGVVDRQANLLGLPQSYFDWSLGSLPPEQADLSMNPGLGNEEVAHRLAAWCLDEAALGARGTSR